MERNRLCPGAKNALNMFETLYKISQLLNSILDTTTLLERIIDLALESVNGERGFVILHNEKTKELEVRVARNIGITIEKELNEISQTALRDVLNDLKPRLFLDAPSDPRLSQSKSIIIKQIRSIACVPLMHKNRSLGAIYVDSKTEHRVLDKDALEFLTAFASIAGLAIENAQLHEMLVEENIMLREELKDRSRFSEIIGHNPKMVAVYELMTKVLHSDCPVLIQGDTGTGKELVARAIHYNSRRSAGPFIVVNCGAIPETLLESELFGYKRGAFTGAHADKPGLFEAANNGTIFFDEIGELPLGLQTKILRVLQDGEMRRLGDIKNIHVDVRFLSATNKDLVKLIEQDRFREDIFYRINVISIKLPTLRERKDDIPLLVNHFIVRYAEKMKMQVKGISKNALDLLISNDWPGNVRELENVLERALILSFGGKIEPEHLSIGLATNDDKMLQTFDAIEKRLILERLDAFGGNKTKTAESLKIALRTLQYKLKRWGIE